MRVDAAAVLLAMGYKLDVDFVAHADRGIDWRSASPMPSESAIDAFDMAPIIAAREAVVADRADFRSSYAASINRLTDIIGETGRNNTQRDAAITDLARIVRRHMKVTKAS